MDSKKYPSFDIIDYTFVVFMFMMFNPILAMHLKPEAPKK